MERQTTFVFVFTRKTFVSAIIWGWRKHYILMFLHSLAKLSQSDEKCWIRSQKFCISLKNLVFSCKTLTFPEKLCIIWSGRKNRISVFLLSLAKLLHPPHKFSICLQKFCIHSENFYVHPGNVALYEVEGKTIFQCFCVLSQSFRVPPRNFKFACRSFAEKICFHSLFIRYQKFCDRNKMMLENKNAFQCFCEWMKSLS